VPARNPAVGHDGRAGRDPRLGVPTGPFGSGGVRRGPALPAPYAMAAKPGGGNGRTNTRFPPSRPAAARVTTAPTSGTARVDDVVVDGEEQSEDGGDAGFGFAGGRHFDRGTPQRRSQRVGTVGKPQHPKMVALPPLSV
jgi:hypothetical protein